MKQTVIQLQQVSKGYKLFKRPVDRLKEAFSSRVYHNTHWALQHVDLDILSGETFGIIGENGAGKSTLLKLIAGTTKPSKGLVNVEGSIAALLELGAGFHPEDTGKDNVYMMGAMNGIAQDDMADYYQQVVEFAELSAEVLARPVKTYSSGMFVRLAFAAATTMEPEVLVIDEALSVGDGYFQKKSLDRIMRFREMGKTVLFCSHTMYQVRALCSKAAWIHEGQIKAIGDTEEVVSEYETFQRNKSGVEKSLDTIEGYSPDAVEVKTETQSPVKLKEIVIKDHHGVVSQRFETFKPMTVEVTVEVQTTEAQPYHVGIVICRSDGEDVFGTSTQTSEKLLQGRQSLSGTGINKVQLTFDPFTVLSGDYQLKVYVLDDTGLQVYDVAEFVYPFKVRNDIREIGITYIEHEWKVEEIQS